MRFIEYLRLNESESTVQPKTKKELIQIIKDTIEKEGFDCDLNFIDTSKITDMIELFYGDVLNKFNGDISKWDVSSVENMTDVFEKCPIKEEYKPEFKKNYGGWA